MTAKPQATDARTAALNVLEGVSAGVEFADALLEKQFSGISEPRDRGLAQELAYGVLRHRLWLDWCIDEVNTGKALKVPETVDNLLRLGAYQVLFCDKIPEYAAVSETVNACRKAGFTKLSGLVNGVLRNLIRHEEPIEPPSPKDDFGRYLSVRYSLPRWIVDRLLRIWNGEDVESFAEASLRIPTLTVRIHPRIISAKDFQENAEEIVMEPHPWIPNAFMVRTGISPRDIPGYDTGGFQVQDAGAQLVTMLLQPEKGETIIEIGSAPGGKTTGISEAVGPSGKVFAADSSERRCEQLRQNIDRLDARNVRILIGDATSEIRELPNRADRVLVDAPCSGLGTLRRRVDLKWRLRPNDIDDLTRTQGLLLENAAKHVRPGGVLVYSTCTVLPDENEDIVNEFCERNDGWTMEPAADILPEEAQDMVLPGGAFQTLPHRDGMDGIFAARLRRND